MWVHRGAPRSKSAKATVCRGLRPHLLAHGVVDQGWCKLMALVLGAAVFAFTFFTYRADIREARARVSTGSTLVQTRCGLIEYAAIGHGPPVLVIHGAGGGYDQGLEFARALTSAGFRVIAMSRFGYLRTPLPENASAAAQADAHACLLDALNIPLAAVVGLSAGAPSSMQFALRHSDRCDALVLVVPAAYVPRPGGTAPVHPAPATEFLFETALRSDFLFWAATRLARSTVVRGLLATPPTVVENASPDEQARVAEIMEHILPVSARRGGLLNDAKVTSSLERYDLERITTSTLLISMADDLFGTFEIARYTAEHVPRARFISYPSGGHVAVGHQPEIMSEIAAFLKTSRAQ